MTKAFIIFLFGSIGVFLGMAALYLAIKCLVILANRLERKENTDAS
ncbi:MAG: hypothetical protein N2260_10225 [Syntrophobacterales bacterium]|nr:hypothetical protein [Syntrophobacterales bacterium]